MHDPAYVAGIGQQARVALFRGGLFHQAHGPIGPLQCLFQSAQPAQRAGMAEADARHVGKRGPIGRGDRRGRPLEQRPCAVGLALPQRDRYGDIERAHQGFARAGLQGGFESRACGCLRRADLSEAGMVVGQGAQQRGAALPVALRGRGFGAEAQQRRPLGSIAPAHGPRVERQQQGDHPIVQLGRLAGMVEHGQHAGAMIGQPAGRQRLLRHIGFDAGQARGEMVQVIIAPAGPFLGPDEIGMQGCAHGGAPVSVQRPIRSVFRKMAVSGCRR